MTPVLSVGVTHCTGVTCYYVLCRFLGWRSILTPRCFTWGRSWSFVPGSVSWLPPESIMKQPFFGAQFWKSNTTRRHHHVLLRAFSPECLQCAPCPARRWVASEGRGFRFPFVGTYTRSSVVVAAHAWEDFHSHKVPRLAAVDVLNLASGLWPTDLLPAPCGSQSHPRGATPAQLWVVWRQWQQGRQAWREPAYEAVPSWVEGTAQ